MSNEYLQRWRKSNPEKVLAYQKRYDQKKREAKAAAHKLACQAHDAAREAGVRPWGEEYKAWIADYIATNR
jgi:hypothetical protein